jgi:hypothetical protein
LNTYVVLGSSRYTSICRCNISFTDMIFSWFSALRLITHCWQTMPLNSYKILLFTMLYTVSVITHCLNETNYKAWSKSSVKDITTTESKGMRNCNKWYLLHKPSCMQSQNFPQSPNLVLTWISADYLSTC